jgi:hypothetical protein
MSDAVERDGFSITFTDTSLVDQSRNVESSPYSSDTDGDGLSDDLEFSYKTDPEAADTDGDGLWDGEEALRWGTKATSVDSDVDSEGDPRLFDGQELFADALVADGVHPDERTVPKVGATNPYSSDTDGDGRDDHYEITTDAYSPVIAELPRIKLDLPNNLSITYRSSDSVTQGELNQLATTMTRDEGVSSSNTRSDTLSASLTVSTEVTASLTGAEVTSSLSATVGTENSFATTSESSRSFGESISRVRELSESETHTVDGAKATIVVALSNISDIGASIGTPSIGVGYLSDVTGKSSIVTLELDADLDDPLTLARQGDSEDGLTFSKDLSLDDVEALLAPGRHLEFWPEFSNVDVLVDNSAESLPEASLTYKLETANLVIDFGHGDAIDVLIATNANRSAPDEPTGLSLYDAFAVLEDLYGPESFKPIPGDNGDIVAIERNGVRHESSPSDTTEFWQVFTITRSVEAGDVVTTLESRDRLSHVENVLMNSSQKIIVAYSEDDDNDGLVKALEEDYLGTDDMNVNSDGECVCIDMEIPMSSEECKNPQSVTEELPVIIDSDNAGCEGDALCDADEANRQLGWRLCAGKDVDLSQSYCCRLVHSNPGIADFDEDGLLDHEEYAEKTDPNDPDTDGDGMNDGDEVSAGSNPLRPAGPVYVAQDGVDCDPAEEHGCCGTTWENACATIQAAIDEVANDPDKTQIWVAQGIYSVTEPLNLVSHVKIYGGFREWEELGVLQRANTLCDRNVAWRPTIEASASTRAMMGQGLSGVVLDSLIIIGSGIELLDPNDQQDSADDSQKHTFRKLMFQNCESGLAGGALAVQSSHVEMRNCDFWDNDSDVNGGAISAVGSKLTLVDCDLNNNTAPSAGAIYCEGASELNANFCTFRSNKATLSLPGGAIYARDSRTTIGESTFLENELSGRPGQQGAPVMDPDLMLTGGAMALFGGEHEVVNTVFDGNRAPFFGAAISIGEMASDVGGDMQLGSYMVVHCTFVRNRTLARRGSDVGPIWKLVFNPPWNFTYARVNVPNPDDPNNIDAMIPKTLATYSPMHGRCIALSPTADDDTLLVNNSIMVDNFFENQAELEQADEEWAFFTSEREELFGVCYGYTLQEPIGWSNDACPPPIDPSLQYGGHTWDVTYGEIGFVYEHTYNSAFPDVRNNLIPGAPFQENQGLESWEGFVCSTDDPTMPSQSCQYIPVQPLSGVSTAMTVPEYDHRGWRRLADDCGGVPGADLGAFEYQEAEACGEGLIRIPQPDPCVPTTP